MTREYAQAIWTGDGPYDFAVRKTFGENPRAVDEGHFLVEREVGPWRESITADVAEVGVGAVPARPVQGLEDHEGNARSLLARAKHVRPEVASGLREEALVHATLALVEVQRAAGLLAFAAMQVEFPSGAVIGTSADGVVALRTEAGDLLGVPDELPTGLGVGL